MCRQLKINNELALEEKELYEEVLKLKKQIEYLKKDEYLNQVKWERDLNENIVAYLTNRIDKAIEYIEKEYNEYNREFDSYQIWLEDLLDILKGE